MTFTKPLRVITVILLVLGFIGLVDAAYLTFKFYRGAAVECSIGIFSGCGEVTNSAYATLGPIPIALFGAMYYLTVLGISVGALETKNPRLLRFIFPLVTGGFVASIWLTYLQISVINALCEFCLLSALISTVLFGASISSMLMLRKQQGQKLES